MWNPIIASEQVGLICVFDRSSGKRYSYQVHDWSAWLVFKKKYKHKPKTLINKLKTISTPV